MNSPLCGYIPWASLLKRRTKSARRHMTEKVYPVDFIDITTSKKHIYSEHISGRLNESFRIPVKN